MSFGAVVGAVGATVAASTIIGGLEVIRCQTCGKKFKGRRNYNAHMKGHRSRPKAKPRKMHPHKQRRTRPVGYGFSL